MSARAAAARRNGDVALAEAIERQIAESKKKREQNYQEYQSWSKYADDLDSSAMNAFNEEFSQRSERLNKTVQTRIDQHLNWLKSTQLCESLHAYDRKHAPAGQAFQHQIGLAISGSNYTEAGSAIALQWAKDHQINASNLLMRAYCLNQQEIEDKLKASLAAAQNAPPQGDPAWWKFMDTMQGGMKNTADSFDKAYAAISDSSGAAWQVSSPVGQGMAVYATFGQSLFRFGMQPSEHKLATACLAMMSGPLGKLASRVRLVDLQYAGSKVPKPTDQLKSIKFNKAYAKTGLTDLLKEGPNGDYHKIRIGVLIGFIEAFGLFVKASKADKGTVRFSKSPQPGWPQPQLHSNSRPLAWNLFRSDIRIRRLRHTVEQQWHLAGLNYLQGLFRNFCGRRRSVAGLYGRLQIF